MKKSRHQSLLDRFQQAQDRIKVLEDDLEMLQEELHTLTLDTAVSNMGKQTVFGPRRW